MRILNGYQGFLLLLLLLSACFLLTNGRGRGGGGRGGGSRGSSSRGRPSSSSSSSRNPYRERPSERRPPSYPSYPAPAPKPVEAPKPKPPAPAPAPAPAPQPPSAPKPSAPEIKPQESSVVRQPAYNPNYKEPSPNQASGQGQPAYNPNYPNNRPPANQQPPPYSPRENPPAYSPAGQPPSYQGAPPPAYNPNQPSAPLGQPPPYSAGQPRQPGLQPPPYPQQPGMRPAPYPQQPGVQPPPYPQQPGMRPAPYPQQPGMRPAPYPQQPGFHYPQQPGMHPAPYPQQPGWNRMPYPQQPGSYRSPYPQNTLGGNVWHPQSGMPAPAYMNYGGLPTGANMYSKPHKKKGFLGSLMSFGSTKPHKTKYHGAYPSPYGMGAGSMGGFMGKHGSKAAMYTILPYMAAKRSKSIFKPRFGFMPIFLPFPHYHHHHYGYGYNGYSQTYYNVYNTDYIGRCNKPLTPENAKIQCNSTNREVRCNVECEEGYRYPDNTTVKRNTCWHAGGVWRPEKNFPACKAVCNETCQHGGECIRPNVCGCPAEYRGPHCEFHFLNCDIRQLAVENKIRWVCTHTRNESTCNVKCTPPAEFITPPAEVYTCNPQGVWTPDSIPKCVIKSETEDKQQETPKEEVKNSE